MAIKEVFIQIWDKIRILGNKVKEVYYLLRLSSIIIGVILAFLAYLGIRIPLEMGGTPKPELYATVDCECPETPFCVDEEAKKLVGIIDDVRKQVRGESERIEKLRKKYGKVGETAEGDSTNDPNKDVLRDLNKDLGGIREPSIAENLDYKCPDNIGKVMNAKGLYNIIVYNKGDFKSKKPTVYIPNYFYAEVINPYSKTTKKFWGPNEIELGSSIYGGTKVKVNAWLEKKVVTQDTKRIKIFSGNSGPAEIFVSTPVLFPAKLLHKYIKPIFYISLLLVIVHFGILLGKLRKRPK